MPFPYVGRSAAQFARACAFVFLIVLAASARLADAQTPDVATVQARAQAAYFAGNAEELRRLAVATAPWAKSRSNAELYAHAYVQFRLLQLAVAERRKDEAARSGDACTGTLDVAVARDPRFVEGLALQSACYGYLAGLGGFGAIGNGTRSGKTIDAAQKLDARNPRVQLVNGFGLYFRPRFVGGDKDKGCASMRSAAAAFDALPAAADPAAISWGAAEAHLWAGRCAGDAVTAQREFGRALALAPDFKAAKSRLTR